MRPEEARNYQGVVKHGLTTPVLMFDSVIAAITGEAENSVSALIRYYQRP